jgi:WD40 repeat protein
MLCDSRTGAVILYLQGHSGRLRALRFSADGRRLVSAGTDGSLRLWELPDPASPGRLSQPAGK